MKNVIVKSILVLGLICLCTSLLLAVTNRITSPIIEDLDRQAALDALAEVMPGGTDFAELALPEGTSKVITAAWRSAEGGYVFRLSATGYAPGIIIMCGIGPDGLLTGVKTVSDGETAGYGKRCEEPAYQAQYKGQAADLSGVAAISGATKTSVGYKAAVSEAFTLFEKLTEEAGK